MPRLHIASRQRRLERYLHEDAPEVPPVLPAQRPLDALPMNGSAVRMGAINVRDCVCATCSHAEEREQAKTSAHSWEEVVVPVIECRLTGQRVRKHCTCDSYEPHARR